MKQRIIWVLTLSVLMSIVQTNSHAYSVYEYDKCDSRKSDAECGYYKSTYMEKFVSHILPGSDEDSCCVRSGGVCTYGCFIPSYQICVANDTGHDEYSQCADVCGAMGYDAFVSGYQDGTYGCACQYDDEWRDYKTGVLRRYTREYQNGRGCVDVALDEYKCASGYYGTAPNGCKVCPANARCTGGLTFYCDWGYYLNAAKTGCNRCPDSKEGGLGWDANGNGVAADNGVESIDLCEISVDTVLYDNTGTFEVTDDGVGNGCLYEP